MISLPLIYWSLENHIRPPDIIVLYNCPKLEIRIKLYAIFLLQQKLYATENLNTKEQRNFTSNKLDSENVQLYGTVGKVLFSLYNLTFNCIFVIVHY
jgi:hypothetical protein